MCCLFFFFKQKTAYEMRISDWSSDVCSSDLTRIYEAFRKAFETFDFLALPTAQVFPFDVEQHWPREIAGVKMDSYHRWMEVTLPPTMAGLPVLAIPAGFGGPHRLPIGIQLIGPRNADLAVLKLGDRKSTRLNSSH